MRKKKVKWEMSFKIMKQRFLANFKTVGVPQKGQIKEKENAVQECLGGPKTESFESFYFI